MKQQTMSTISFIGGITITFLLFKYMLDPFSIALWHHPYNILWKIFFGLIISGACYGALNKQQAIEKISHGGEKK